MARTGRPREFDVDEALVKARDLFWEKGYAATSVQDLVEELGIQRASLYAAFGDKHSLFLQALSLYVRGSEDELERLVLLDDGAPVLPALRRALTDPWRLIDPARSIDSDSSRGCLVANTSAELAPAEEAARQAIAAAHAGTVRILSTALERGQASGEVSRAASPETQARMLLCLMQGFALVARAGEDTAPLIAAIEAALQGLEA